MEPPGRRSLAQRRRIAVRGELRRAYQRAELPVQTGHARGGQLDGIARANGGDIGGIDPGQHGTQLRAEAGVKQPQRQPEFAVSCFSGR